MSCDKKKPIKTIPQGVWEASHSTDEKKNKEKQQNIASDLQGNGYVLPEDKKK